MIATGRIVSYDGENLTIKIVENVERELLQKQVDNVEIRLNDGREISADQRKKIFALLRDISTYSGHEMEYLRELTEFQYRLINGIDPFSLSKCSVSIASGYINYLVEFCIKNEIPMKQSLLEQTEDIGKYLYLCIEYRKCCICGKAADIHHVDVVGIGRNRHTINHIGMRAMALCREHHQEAHQIGINKFNELHHIYGIKLDEYLVKKARIK